MRASGSKPPRTPGPSWRPWQARVPSAASRSRGGSGSRIRGHRWSTRRRRRCAGSRGTSSTRPTTSRAPSGARSSGPKAAAPPPCCTSAVGRRAPQGWPARITGRWIEETVSPGGRGARIDLPLLPEALGAASFARALCAFGFAVRASSASGGSSAAMGPFSMMREPGFVAAHRLGFVFGALPADADWQARALGVGRRTALAQARVLARTALLEARMHAARLLLGDDAAPAPRDVFDELGAAPLRRRARRPLSRRLARGARRRARALRRALARSPAGRVAPRSLRRRLVPQPARMGRAARDGGRTRPRAARDARARSRSPRPRRAPSRKPSDEASVPRARFWRWSRPASSMASPRRRKRPTAPRHRRPPPRARWVRPAPPLPMLPSLSRVRVEAARDHVTRRRGAPLSARRLGLRRVGSVRGVWVPGDPHRGRRALGPGGGGGRRALGRRGGRSRGRRAGGAPHGERAAPHRAAADGGRRRSREGSASCGARTPRATSPRCGCAACSIRPPPRPTECARSSSAWASPEGCPSRVGRVQVASLEPAPWIARAEATLCGPDAESRPLALALVPKAASPSAAARPADPPILPAMAVRHASDDLCVRWWAPL